MPNLPRILMILTNARRDCAALTLDMLVKSGSLPVFDRVVFLLNGVTEKHMRFVDGFIQAHPEVKFDKVLGPGTRPEGISWMQNECIRRYPGGLYMKIDEDVFVPAGWAQRMVEAYEANRQRDNLSCKLRGLVLIELTQLNRFKGDKTDAAQVRAVFDEKLAGMEGKSWQVFFKRQFDNYLKDKPEEAKIQAEIAGLEKELYRINQPQPHRYELRRTGSESGTQEVRNTGVVSS